MHTKQTIHTEAWLLAAAPAPAELRLQSYHFGYDPEREVLFEPLLGCWEANMDHALQRQPVDVCALRQEDPVVLGNGGVVRILEPGPRKDLQPGQCCLLLSFGLIDHPLGFPRAAHAYDAPGTVGLLAKRSKALPHQLLALPAELCQDEASLASWAAWALRYVTAWGNWEIAHGTYQLLQPPPQADTATHTTNPPWVLAWGGGVAFAELQLARAAGYRVAMFTSRPWRQAYLEAHGIKALLRPPGAHSETQAGKSGQREAEAAMLQALQTVLGPQGAAIVIDLIGTPVLRLSLKALGCPGVLTTAGWKDGMQLQYQRALACMSWQSFVHTHYARPDQAAAAFAYAREHAWYPVIDPQRDIWDWSAVPSLASAYRQGLDTYFPLYRVNAL